MIKSFCYRLLGIAALLLWGISLAQANPCHSAIAGSKEGALLKCDVAFTTIPTFSTPMSVISAQTGIFTITNNTPATVSLLGITITPPNGALTRDPGVPNNCGATLAAGASCNIKIDITPTVPGTITFAVEVDLGGPRGGSISTPPISITVTPAPPFPPVPPLAADCTILAATTITNTGPSVITGDLCLTPGTSITGFPPGILINGVQHIADGRAVTSSAANLTLYNTLAGAACPLPNNLTGQDLGGQTLTPGVYCFDTSAGLNGPTPLTLDGQGDINAVFIVQIGSTLISGSNTQVVLTNGARAVNVFWQIGSSATFGTNTAFQGTILALTSVGFNTGATLINGRVVALNGAVTLDSNTVTPGL